ncbi:hypothetical protein [Alteromonas sp. KUL49]|uniref:hypothetical protein n=1 Tax=Alteromonas sp. KUL49 TaxID=2480798 RepID=UPI00102EDE21|nr:hypothetical protein [Alteromonas sp. KUL49]
MSNKVLLVALLVIGIAMMVGGITWQMSGGATVAGGDVSMEAQEKAGGQQSPASDSSKVSTEPAGDLELSPVGSLPVSSDISVVDDASAEQVLAESKSDMGLGEDDTLPILSHSDDGYGHTFYHTQQYYKGIPVYGTEMVLNTQNNQASEVIGTWLTSIELDVVPTLDAEQALIAAYRSQGVPDSRQVVVTQDPTALVVYPTENRVILAWIINGRLTDPQTEDYRHVVNAHAGEMILKLDLVHQ